MGLWAGPKAKSLASLPGEPGWAAQARPSLDYSLQCEPFLLSHWLDAASLQLFLID